jgi:hypothetical protein
MFKVPVVKTVPPVALELFPVKFKVPPVAFIVVSPVYVLVPERVFVPVPVTVKPLPGVVPLTIAPVTLMFAVPARDTVVAVALVERLKPFISRVFPAPLAVIVTPEVPITSAIVNVVPFPNKFTPLEPDKVTVPVPRLRLFTAVFVADPKFSAEVPFHVNA